MEIGIEMKRSQINRRGPKTLVWAETRRKLKIVFEAAGIIRCEKCGDVFALGFAHSLPRADIKTKEDMEECALLCSTHHQSIDDKGHEYQFDQIRHIIANREVAVAPLS